VKLPRRQFLHLAAGAAALPVASHFACAQTYPLRPVRIIVGFPAGSGPDVVARLVGQRLSERLGQQFIVENRAGAGSSIAAHDVINAPADGYTLLMATTANTINTTLYPNLDFNFVRDVAPVAVINGAPFVMVMNQGVPVKGIREFVTYAKANPGKINMASPGVGTTPDLCYELFKLMTGVNLVHVPYRGSYLADLISGQVQVAFSTVAQAIGYVRAGELRALAVTSTARVDALPDVPTVAEFVPGYDADGWFGFVAPKGAPTEIIDRLNKETNSVVADPGMKTQLIGLGAPPMSMTPAEFGKLIADHTKKWAKVIHDANITAD